MRSVLLFVLLMSGWLVGCRTRPTPPTDAPDPYTTLVQLASAEAREASDSTFLWLRNTDPPRARTLMLELGLDYVRYDETRGVLCAWAGGGMDAAHGYVFRLSDSLAVPADSLGDACYRSGGCSETPLTDDWTAFRCL